jgi:hypothetical protein
MKPILVANPADDGVFAARALEHLKNGATTIGELERRIRTTYPRAAVHARELAAEGVVIWYVYREGRWLAAPPAAQRSDKHGMLDRREDR